MLLAPLALIILAGCQKAPAAKDAGEKPAAAAEKAPAEKDEEKPEKSEGVTVNDEQAGKIGLKTSTLKNSDYFEQTEGYGAVLPHETIANALAELATAEAMERQSRAALARTERLSGTPGALSAEALETAQRQASVDAAALALARQKLSAAFGQDPPWHEDVHSALLESLATGAAKLVRVTFPLGVLPGEAPAALHASRLGASQKNKRWPLTPLWQAPADAAVPGRSYFAVLRAKEVGEGERLVAFAPVGEKVQGVIVPNDAVVISDNKYWCYRRVKEDAFVRVEFDADKPADGGYFVDEGIKAGDIIVTHGAAQLLAQESNAGPEAD
jgi:hypothetical protein